MKTRSSLDGQLPAKAETDNREAWKQHLRTWGIYAAAAGAALATASRADADIIYSGPLDFTVTSGPPNDQTFSINHHQVELYAVAGYPMIIFPGQVIGNLSAGIHRYPAAVPVGLYHFMSGGGFGFLSFRPDAWGFGTKTGFVGFQTAGGDLGWIDVKVSGPADGGPFDEAAALGYAYNDVPGAPILTGQLPTAAVPEPGSLALALLAIGAGGLIAWRKRRAERQTQ